MTQISLQSLPPEQVEELRQLASDMNDKLFSAGSSSAERAFGIGCGLGLLPVIAVAIILYVLGVINLILAVVVGVLAVLFLVSFAALLASIARANVVKRTYQSDVVPAIEKYLYETGRSRAEFDTLVAELLPQGSPLLEFLSPLRQVEQDEPE
jgi:hypothetical protein